MNNKYTDLFKGKTVLVTGGIGSIGLEIVKQLLTYSPKEILVYDNRETELFYVNKLFKEYKIVTPIFGDIRDMNSVSTVMKDVDIVFHAAAMKHVEMCEKNPFEAIKTNVLGTDNVINASMKNNVQKVILISTDKSVNPTNVMGATKLLAERLVSATCMMKKNPGIKFGVVRFGNVLSSRGSVLEIWQNQISNGDDITITDPDMTRFFMSIPASVDLIFNATLYGEYGEIYIFKMPSVKIIDLARAYLRKNNISEDRINVIGKHSGEKMHEELINIEEEQYLMENNDMFVRVPIFYEKEFSEKFKKLGFEKTEKRSYSSNDETNLLSVEKITSTLLQH